MIRPDSLVDHAEQLADAGPGRPRDADVRRGVSAAYYAVFHDLTGRAARHLVGSFPQETQNEIRRTWSHGEIARLAKYVVDRANVLKRNPDAPLPANLKQYGRLFDIAATDADLVDGLRTFNQMQEQRHSADYDHNAQFTKSALVEACENARLARTRLDDAQDQARRAFFALLTVGRTGFRQR